MLNDYIRRSDVLKLFDEWGGGFAYIEVETDGAIKDVNNLPSAPPDNRLSKIADLVEGTIDHFDLNDAMDVLYQIKEILP